MRDEVCKNCGKAVAGGENAKYLPFCSKKCQLADLGKWFDEKYRIADEAGEIDPAELGDYEDDFEREDGDYGDDDER